MLYYRIFHISPPPPPPNKEQKQDRAEKIIVTIYHIETFYRNHLQLLMTIYQK